MIYLYEYLKRNNAYMLRNDGEIFELNREHPYIIRDKYASIEDSLDRLFNLKLDQLIWFYKNTQYKETKQLINRFVSNVINFKLLTKNLCKKLNDIFDINYNIVPKDLSEVHEIMQLLNDQTNQEFCRFRTSGLFYNEGKDEICFRISSIHFNWFDLIWKSVYDNRNIYKNITICYDDSMRNVEYVYKIGHNVIVEFPIKEFIALSGNPTVESIFNKNIYSCEKNNLLNGNSFIDSVYPKTDICLHEKFELEKSKYLKCKCWTKINNYS